MTRDEAVSELHQLLKPGDTVQTILRHVSRSGMTRTISPIINGRNRSYVVAAALDYKTDDKRDGIKIGGCGMDMGFHLVYNLSRTLWPKGYQCCGDEDGRRCRSNDHSNGDRSYNPHIHEDGGYALNQEWL